MTLAQSIDYSSDAQLEGRTMRKVLWRLLPFMISLYILNYLDRVNVGFAKLQMNADLGFSDAVYGFGASIFFVGYFIFEVPSNLILHRVGARRWLARIMISWGIVSSSMMFVRGEWSFYALRLLLGLAEAGFFPGMILYISYWVPAERRARAVAWFMTSTALSGVIGGPLAGVLLGIEGLGLRGWQWMFLLEGLPTIGFGVAMLWYLTDRPDQATWLADDERAWLVERMRREHDAAPDQPHSLGGAMGSGRVWLLAAIYGCVMFGFYGINYWTPSVIKEATGGSTRAAASLSAIVFLAAAIAMVFIGRVADRFGERRLVLAVSATVGAIGMAVAAWSRAPAPVIAGLSLAAVGIWGTLGPFWAMPAQFLRGAAAAAGIALINSLGNLGGGFIGPNLMGHLKESTKTYSLGLYVNGGVLLMAALLTLALIATVKRADVEATRD